MLYRQNQEKGKALDVAANNAYLSYFRGNVLVLTAWKIMEDISRWLNVLCYMCSYLVPFNKKIRKLRKENLKRSRVFRSTLLNFIAVF